MTRTEAPLPEMTRAHLLTMIGAALLIGGMVAAFILGETLDETPTPSNSPSALVDERQVARVISATSPLEEETAVAVRLSIPSEGIAYTGRANPEDIDGRWVRVLVESSTEAGVEPGCTIIFDTAVFTEVVWSGAEGV